jgi:16S rRNA (guanine966-N2)-methyltransferase
MAPPGRLRIIAGELRGRRIRVPAGPVRPTAERAREGLFSILGAAVVGTRVLDAYSGSGALGFEALSRGAREIVFLESDSRALAALAHNMAELGVTDRCRVVAGPVVRNLERGSVCGPFGLVLADPPYAGEEAARLLPLAAEQLARGGVLVLERDGRSSPLEPAEGSLTRFRSVRYGRCRFDWYRRGAAAEPG